MNQRIKNTSSQGQKIAKAACEWAYSGRPTVYHDIYEAYERPSVYKVRAWNYCKELCKKMHGFDLVICGKNSMKFSAMFQFVERGTGALCYAYITKDYDRFCYQ